MNNQSQIEILDSMNTATDYKGSVTVKYLDKDGKQVASTTHNEGKIALFTAVTRALAGLTISDYVPTMIMGYYGSEYSEAFTQKISYYTTPTLYLMTNGTPVRSDSGQSDVVEYTFLVPLNNLRQTTDAINRLVLYNNNGDQCALVDLSSTIATNISSSILINQRLYFTNPTTTA